MDDRLKEEFRAAAGGQAIDPASSPADAERYLTDWRGTKTGAASLILRPGTTSEVADVVRLAAREGVPLVPQGGNSGLVGGSVPEGDGTAVLLSLERMNEIQLVDAEGATARVQAGVILQTLHEAAAESQLMFPLSLGAKGSATIGGLISTNAGGTQVLRYGAMRAQVLGLEAVLAGGNVLNQLAPLRKDNTGYDLKQLLIGAEGTLGIVTRASLRLLPAPAETATALVGLSSPAAALQLLARLQAATGGQVDSFELIPRIAVDLVTAHVDNTRDPLAAGHAWYVLAELTGTGAEGTQRGLLETALAAAIEDGLAADAVLAGSGREREELWRLRETIAEAERADGLAIKHDISVPVSDMPRFVTEVGAEIERRWPGTSMIAFGHLGDGNIHFNVRSTDALDRDDLIALRPEITGFVYEQIAAAGGSISAEHGIGTLKAEALARLGDPGKLAAMRAVKRALDPHGIMNPGKVFA
ncbi:hydroxyacid dehydrogenase [Pacificimonas flava]|uniref:Hydroxyacid dehydrogenase n=2 Tax=Pacificimonas TaxID=1960290 RepID=A0A219B317_9SPHN|nr:MULTISPECIES: FAD-binding oxidoreductase [Pacificimonas]MBZ6378148.1 FAD-binding oxidoreductase [Pacificimonas aurantium]OWV32218.1 hydroxyacid dehydrogenase [Pacificimonas flava]